MEKISCDFEKAVHSAVDELLPNAKVSGWIFHFNQSIFNNMKKKNCLPVYNNMEAFRTLISNLYPLAFVPPLEVIIYNC